MSLNIFQTIELIESVLDDGPLTRNQLETILENHGIYDDFHTVLNRCRRHGTNVTYVAGQGYILAKPLPPGTFRRGDNYFYRLKNGHLSEPCRTADEAFNKLKTVWNY